MRAVGQETVNLGIVLQKEEIDNRWIKYRWRAAAAIAGAPDMDPKGEWVELAQGGEEGGRWWHFHAGTLPLHLYRKETGGYLLNLNQEPPRVWVVLRDGVEARALLGAFGRDAALGERYWTRHVLRDGVEAGASEHTYVPVAATVCPYEAQDFLDSGEDLVEVVAMPEAVLARVQHYVDEHHKEEEFYKRKRKPHSGEQEAFVRRGGAPVDRRKPKKLI